ncbi:hypothetical protein [Asticcacaulis excentricus]|uniref:hypothetical protein n=1 Tax=Asticcacaulis excentricus TaxID=78587 RepID=UPI000F816A20|nr:hypothetical protein [Asticcacaulis excentricus]
MDWFALVMPADRRALAKQLLVTIEEVGANRKALCLASIETFGHSSYWKKIFPSGVTEVLWFISEVSDASMASAFSMVPANDMKAVIDTRFEQNRDLKRFVWQVMIYDLRHPIQALKRMQRTAGVMMDCLGARPAPRFFHLASLNLVYTMIVFVWLTDRTPENRRTKAVTQVAMRWLGL